MVSVSGLTVLSLTQWLTQQSPAPSVKQAIFHVGVNDCCELAKQDTANGISTHQWQSLISQLKRVFPHAQLQASAIIPALGRNPLNTIIHPSNQSLSQVCETLGVTYVDHNATFRTQSGAPRMALYKDDIHPSFRGIKDVAQTLFPPRRRPPLLPTPQHTHENPVSNTRGPKPHLLPPPLSHDHFPALPSNTRTVTQRPLRTLHSATPPSSPPPSSSSPPVSSTNLPTQRAEVNRGTTHPPSSTSPPETPTQQQPPISVRGLAAQRGQDSQWHTQPGMWFPPPPPWLYKCVPPFSPQSPFMPLIQHQRTFPPPTQWYWPYNAPPAPSLVPPLPCSIF